MYFKGVGQSTDYLEFHAEVKDFVDSIHEPLIDVTSDEELLDKEISSKEIVDAINSIHSGKAPGYSGVPVELFKHASPLCIDLLHLLYNRILTTGVYPEEWMLGVIVPIY